MAPPKDRDRLEVVVLEAQGLLAVAGGVANSYISVEFGGEKRRTAVETGTVDPVWDEEIMIFSEISVHNMENLVLIVKHHDPFGSVIDRTLGMVIVDTATSLQAPGISTQDWYPMRRGPGMKVGDVPQGQVHVKVTYFVNNPVDIDELEALAAEGDEGKDDDIDAKLPNVITILVEAGRNLRPPGSRDLCDPLVVLRCGGETKQCKAQKRTNNPKWHFQAQITNSDPHESFIVGVQHDGILSKKFIGQARLTMVEIAQAGESLTQWMPLLDERGGFDAAGRGEVLVTARWHHDENFTSQPKGISATRTGRKSNKIQEQERERHQALEAMVGEFEYEDDHDDEKKLQKRTQEGLEDMEEEERERERQALIANAELQERIDAVRPGDYQLQVHVIEVSGVKGKDASGTSDPIVYASCLGLTKHTRVRKRVTSAIFDEVLYFDLPNLSREQLMRATVNIRVLDANTFQRDSLIGSHQFDLLGVYTEKDHEVYRTWVGLLETETGRETGFQGFLKLSVTVLGPGDRQRVHNLAEEMQEEIAREAEVGAGGMGGGMILGLAPISQELSFLVVYVFSAEDLPRFSAVGDPSINAVVQVDFGGNPPVHTTAVKARDRHRLSPVWAQELWLPVMVPPSSTMIDLSVWHEEITGRNVVAHAYFDFNDTEEKFGRPPRSAPEQKTGLFQHRAKRHPGPPPIWVNLYGAQAGKGKGREAVIMNRYPSRGSAYRGRVLMAIRVETRPPSEMTSGTRRFMDFEVPPEIRPQTAKYTLRAIIFQGSDIPIFKFLDTQVKSKMRVMVTLGRVEIDFEAKSNKNGIVEWNRGEELHTLELPADPAQIPDIIIYLVRDTPEARVSYARIPAVDVLSQRFRGEPYWQELVADRTRQGLWALGSDDFPGSLLLRLGLGRNNFARQHPWEDMISFFPPETTAVGTLPKPGSSVSDREDKYAGGGDANDRLGKPQLPAARSGAAQGPLGEKKPYCLRAHVFQCRDLPSSEATGLLDPYVKVRFMGQKQKTANEANTVHPCFYQTMEFHEMLPCDLRFAAEIRVEVWDNDRLGSNTHMAGCRFPVLLATLSSGSSSHVPAPRWHQLRDTNGDPGVGEILLSLQLIPKISIHDKLPQAPSIMPILRTAFLEIITVGVRDLKPYGFQAVAQPYAHFETTSGGERVSFTTRTSDFPSGNNANFLERKVLNVLLPEDPLYAPHLCIRVLDNRMSGLTNPVVGTCSVPLAVKMPWNDAGYRPPQTQSFNAIKSFESCDTKDDDLSGGDVEARATPRTSTPSPDQKRRFSKPVATSETTVALFTESGGRARMSCQERDVGGQREEEGTGAHTGSRTAADCDPLNTGRSANFGIGAVDLRQEGGGVGLYLPPIEEDATFERATTRLGLERASHGRGDGAGIESELREEKNPLNIAAVECKRRFPGEPTWYERLVIGGGNALGIIDKEEEDRWKLEELDIDFPREWANSEFMEGRNWWLKRKGGGSEIENFLKKAPFENYHLFLGAEKLKSGFRLFPQAHRRKVGLLKGLVVVSETSPDPNFSEFVDMTRLRVPQTYCCRLYVVKGLHLQPKDLNGLADPYLQLKVGKLTIDDGEDKENIKKETLNPEFFRSFEFRVTMPGESQLTLNLYDYDRFGADDFIGQTTIDLEDRWFSRGWHELEREDPVAYERWEAQGAPYKPLEVRDLSVPSSGIPQGQVMMWLDILTLPEARLYPLTKLKPPAPLKFEVRVVCWRSEDVVASDDFTGLRDLYCRLWMEAEPKKKKETDTHWRCKNGKGYWNYRIKFDVELPLKSREHGRLVFQMWDRDTLSANDIVAETSIDLYRWFLKVYREQQSIKPYTIIKNARKQETHHDYLIPPGRSYGTAAAATGGRGRWRAGPGYQNGGFTNDRDSGEKNDAPRKINEGRVEGNDFDKTFQDRSFSDYCDEGREGEGDIEGGRVNGDPGDDDPLPSGEKNDSDAEKELLLGPSGAEGTPKTQDTQNYRRARREEANNTDEVVNTIKEWFGVGKAPDDATWLELTKRDPEAGTFERRGKMLISLELLPKDAAGAQPVGTGRNEPNQNPYLPPPTGRMNFSFNPVRPSMSLLGPKAFYKVLCCCICIVIAVGIVMAGDLTITFNNMF